MTATLTRAAPSAVRRMGWEPLRAWIIEEMRAAGVPGLALSVTAGGSMVFAEGFGVTSVESPAPVTPDTVFRIASVTKILTGVAMMRLVEQGVLNLDRPVIDHVPELRLRRPGAAEKVTLRMLLSHTAGLSEGSVERPWRRETRDGGGLATHIRDDLPRLPMVGAPGELYFYSNVGVNLAGYVAQMATGEPFAELLRRLVIEPLGLCRTTLDPTVAMTYPLAQRHDSDARGRLRVRHDGGDNTGFYPSGYAFSTVLDLARVLDLHMAGGLSDSRRLLSAETVREMQVPRVDLRLGVPLGYGLTWLIEPSYKGVRRVGHEGVLRGYCAKVTFAPEARVGVALLYNHEYNERPRFFAVREQIIDTIFDELLGLPPGPAPRPSTPDDLASGVRLRGRYAQLLGATIVEIRDTATGPVLIHSDVTVPLRRTRSCAYESTVPDRDLTTVPWPRTPYVIDDRVSVGVPPGEGPAPYITVNGQAYRRIAAGRACPQ